MRIRPAARTDIAALQRLINASYRGETAKAGWTHEADMLSGQRIDAGMLAEIMDDPAQNLLVLEDGENIAGCINVVDQQSHGYLGLLTIEPQKQAQGLGRKLALAGEDLARSLGLEAMQMTVIRHRSELIAWYERLGYINTGEREAFPADGTRHGIPLRDDLEFVVLRKSL